MFKNESNKMMEKVGLKKEIENKAQYK